MTIPAIEAIGAPTLSPVVNDGLISGMSQTNATSFLDSIRQIDHQVSSAESALQAFAVGDMTSTHELMIAMEQAKFAMQAAVEVRNRVVDAYQELMRMQI